MLHLCQAGIVRSDDYRKTANRFRRSDRLYEGFALAVGANVCATAPLTLGAATARYERDLQYEYRKNAIALFVYVLQRNPGPLEANLDEDYVARIARMIIVSPSTCPRVGPAVVAAAPGPDGFDDDRFGRLSNAVAIAQHEGEEAKTEARGLREELRVHAERNNTDLGLGRAALETMIHDLRAAYTRDMDGVNTQRAVFESNIRGELGGLHAQMDTHFDAMDAWRAQNQAHVDQLRADLTQEAADHRTHVLQLIRDAPRAAAGVVAPVDITLAVNAATNAVETRLTNGIPGVVDTVLNRVLTQPGGISAQVAALQARVNAPAPVAVGGGLATDRDRLANVETLAAGIQTSVGAIVRGLCIADGGGDAAVQARLDGVVNVVAALENGLGATNAGEVNTALQSLMEDQAAVRAGLGATNSTTLQNALFNLGHNQTLFATRVGTVETGLTAVQTGLGGVNTRMDTVEAANTLSTTRITTVAGTVDGLAAAHATLAQAVTDQAETLTTGMRIGQRSLQLRVQRLERGAAAHRRRPLPAPAAADNTDNEIRTRLAPMVTEAMGNLDARIQNAVDAAVAAERANVDAAMQTAARNSRDEIAQMLATFRAAPTGPPAAIPDGLAATVQRMEAFMRRMFGDVDYDQFSRDPAPDGMQYAPGV